MLSDGPLFVTAQVIAVDLGLGPMRRAKICLALVAAVQKWAVSLEANDSIVHLATASNVKAADQLMKEAGARFGGKGFFSKSTIFAVSLLSSYSSAIASGAEPPKPVNPSDAGVPPAIDWNMPSLKDETTPKMLVLCSEHVDEQIARYKLLLKKIGILKGYTILDGNKQNEWTQAIDNLGYLVFINKSIDSKEFQECIANYPKLEPIIADFMQNKIPNQQIVLQKLIGAGALPPGISPSQCYSRFYYPTEKDRRWIAYVGIDYSSIDSCFQDFLLNTFGISPRSCQSAEICSRSEKGLK